MLQPSSADKTSAAHNRNVRRCPHEVSELQFSSFSDLSSYICVQTNLLNQPIPQRGRWHSVGVLITVLVHEGQRMKSYITRGQPTLEMAGKSVTSTTLEKLPHLGRSRAHHMCFWFSKQGSQEPVELSVLLQENAAILVEIAEPTTFSRC